MFPAARVITLGSAQECAVHLDDPAVAARHAVLYVESGKLMIADAGSNGVVVNGQRATSAAVTGLDDIRIGEFRVKVELMQAAGSFKAPETSARPAASRPDAASSRPEATSSRPETSRRDPLGTRPIAPLSRLPSSTTFDPERVAPAAARSGGLADDLLGGASRADRPGARPLDPDELNDHWEGGPTIRLAPELVSAAPPAGASGACSPRPERSLMRVGATRSADELRAERDLTITHDDLEAYGAAAMLLDSRRIRVH